MTRKLLVFTRSLLKSSSEVPSPDVSEMAGVVGRLAFDLLSDDRLAFKLDKCDFITFVLSTLMVSLGVKLVD